MNTLLSRIEDSLKMAHARPDVENVLPLMSPCRTVVQIHESTVHERIAEAKLEQRKLVAALTDCNRRIVSLETQALFEKELS